MTVEQVVGYAVWFYIVVCTDVIVACLILATEAGIFARADR
jgi:hypothetical protein